MTPSSLTDRVLIMASCPEKLCTKAPSGHFHFFILPSVHPHGDTYLLPPAEPLAKLYSVGWIVKARTDFLWWVRVVMLLPAARSHSLRVSYTRLSKQVCALYSGRWVRYSLDGRVHTTRDDLRVGALAFDIRNGTRVSRQGKNVGARSHVPDTHSGVATTGDENV